MKIVHIVPGSGGTFYCQNCLRDTALVRELRRRGHDVLLTPLYLPMFADDAGLARETPVFFGGINVYLQQQFPFFRRTPRWLDRLFDASWMLRLAARRESSTSARDLGPMTLSMLQGGEGNQRKEVDRLVAWLCDQEKPDIVHISNALLLGLAGKIKAALKVPVICSLQDEEHGINPGILILKVPVICSLQDEDTWIDAMLPAHAEQCWQAMTRAGRQVDAFVAVSRWYGDKMRECMQIPPEKLHVIYLGVEMDAESAPVPPPDPPVIGYLSRLAPGQGLDRLVEAFISLKKRPEFRTLQLRATGGITPANREFLDGLLALLREEGMAADVEFVADFGREERRRFLRSLSLLSVPVPDGEAFGAFIIEALACGVPVVQPAVGAFPEVIAETGGGILYDPGRPAAYEEALASLLRDPGLAASLGETGHKAVQARFSIASMTEQLTDLYLNIKNQDRVSTRP